MFEKFTEHARRAVVLAREEARTLQHNHIGAEHLLLGVLADQGGVAARALLGLDITAERVRAHVVRTIGSGEERSSQLPFTPGAKKSLELALRAALSLGHNYIGSEHILLGLVDDTEAVAARILQGLDADPETIRDAVLDMLSAPGGGQQADEEHASRPEDVAIGSSGKAASPHIGGISDAQLDHLIDELVNEEEQISRRRHVLLGEIEILRAERDNRRSAPPKPDS